MYKHLLIATDGSECASAALEKAVEFARDNAAKVTFFFVTEPFHLFTVDKEQVERVRDEFSRYSREGANRHLQWARNLAQAHNVACDTAQLEHERPYEAIIQAARLKECDLIAMGSHGYGGIEAAILGSVTQKVLTHCMIPVLVYPSHTPHLSKPASRHLTERTH